MCCHNILCSVPLFAKPMHRKASGSSALEIFMTVHPALQVLKKRGNLLLLVRARPVSALLTGDTDLLLRALHALACCLGAGRGTRSRGEMCKLPVQDEPENDLDVETLRALENAISNFAGAPPQAALHC